MDLHIDMPDSTSNDEYKVKEVGAYHCNEVITAVELENAAYERQGFLCGVGKVEI